MLTTMNVCNSHVWRRVTQGVGGAIWRRGSEALSHAMAAASSIGADSRAVPATYRREELLRIRAAASPTRLPSDTYARIKSFGILRRARGIRAGINTRRRIRPWISERLCAPSCVTVYRGSSVCLDNLIQCKIVKWEKALRSFQATHFQHGDLSSTGDQPVVILHQNVCSLMPKLEEVRLLLDAENVDVCCLSETWLSHNVDDRALALPGFATFREDRAAGSGRTRGGGVALILREEYGVERLGIASQGPGSSKLESLWVSVKLTGRSVITVGVIYRPPGTASLSDDLTDLEFQAAKLRTYRISTRL